MKEKRKKTKSSRFLLLSSIRDSSLELERRISMIIALSGAVGNSVGFLANFFLYGMNFPTAFCAVCALLIILNLFFGLPTKNYRVFGGVMLFVLDVLEFPLLVFTYGSVMVPYMIIGFLGLLMITADRKRVILCSLLGFYDVAVIVGSSFHPYIFGPQDSAGLLGSAVITYMIALGALSACVIAWQSVATIEANDVDGLTGVYTRAGFLRNAERYLRRESDNPSAVLFFNVNSFKAINTVYGSEGGDRLLQAVSERLKGADFSALALGRLSADHFVALCERKKVDLNALDALCRFQYSDNGKSMEIVMHCGVYFSEDEELEVEPMCDKALAASRMVRPGMTRCHAVYDQSAAQAFREETELLGDLETAIHERSFEPYYQPVVDCKSGKIVSAEALARWRHPERGMISPGIFIPVLEKKELISELDAIIAGKVAMLMTRRDISNKPIVPISVNLSRIDFLDTSFMEKLQVMIESQNRGVGFRFELTESVYEALGEDTIAMISRFRESGAQILVDDFGSGFSSLGMITDYEFDFIKLDMSFAAKLDSGEKARSLVQALVDMAHNLGARVIAEGVETQSQFEYLRSIGCDQIQGYYLFKPLPEKEFLSLLDQQEEG